jgi:hypothetical protein
MRELARRSNHGIEVRLLWHSPTDQVFVVVEDDAGESFELEVDASNALDVPSPVRLRRRLLRHARGRRVNREG